MLLQKKQSLKFVYHQVVTDLLREPLKAYQRLQMMFPPNAMLEELYFQQEQQLEPQ
jgi:hypothetical protein